MMQRNRKATALALATLLTAGCAKSDFRVSARERQTWRPVTDAAVAGAPEAKLPKVLPQTHFAAARLFESQGLLDKAIEQYRKAIAVNHSYAVAYHRLGLVLGITGRHDEAVRTLSRAVELQPNNATVRNDLGFELVLAKRWADAERELSKAVELKPNFARACVNLGMVQSRRGRFEEALATFRAALPEPDAYYNLGLMYRGQQLYENAAETFRHVLLIAPEFSSAQVQLDQLATFLAPEPLQDGTLAPVTAIPAEELPSGALVEADTFAGEAMLETADWADEPCEEPMLPTAAEENWTVAADTETTEPTLETAVAAMPAAAEAVTDKELWMEEEPCPEGELEIEEGSGTEEALWTEEHPSPKDELWTEVEPQPEKEQSTEAEPQPEQEVWIEQEPCGEEELLADMAGEETIDTNAPEELLASAVEREREESVEVPADAQTFVLTKALPGLTEPAELPTCLVGLETKQPGRATCPLVSWAETQELGQKLDMVQDEIACLEEMAGEAAWVMESANRGDAYVQGRLQPVVEIAPGPLSPTSLASPMGPPVEPTTARQTTTARATSPRDVRRKARLVSDREIIPPNNAAETAPRVSGKVSNHRSGVSRKAKPVIAPAPRNTLELDNDWREDFKELEVWSRIVAEEIECWKEVDLLAASVGSGGKSDLRIHSPISPEKSETCPATTRDSEEALYDLPEPEPFAGASPY